MNDPLEEVYRLRAEQVQDNLEYEELLREKVRLQGKIDQKKMLRATNHASMVTLESKMREEMFALSDSLEYEEKVIHPGDQADDGSIHDAEWRILKVRGPLGLAHVSLWMSGRWRVWSNGVHSPVPVDYPDGETHERDDCELLGGHCYALVMDEEDELSRLYTSGGAQFVYPMLTYWYVRYLVVPTKGGGVG